MEPHPASDGAPLGFRGVLRIAAFRKLWIALSLSSLGDWLGLLAQSALAKEIAGQGYEQQTFAVAGVFALRLVPAVIFGPIAGVVADRLDRRWTMVVGDSARCLLFVSIPVVGPLVGRLWWLFVATFLIEVAAMFWIPAKEATVPNLVPRAGLESANQVSLLTAYGTAPIAAVVFTLLALVTRVFARHFSFFTTNPVDLALYFDALTFLFSALTIARLHGIPKRTVADVAVDVTTGVPVAPDADLDADPDAAARTPFGALIDGWRFIGRDRRIRGLVIGIVGAFAAGGAVIGLANTYVADLGGGQAGYGVLFGAVFVGLAAGMSAGPRVLSGLPRERLFGLAIGGAGLTLCVLALVPNLVVAALCALVIGFFGGTAWITGQTMLGLDVADELRGRTFAFVQSLIRVVLVLILAAAPAVAGPLGRNRVRLPGGWFVTYGGAAITLFAAGLVAAGVGWVAYRMMDPVPGKSLRTAVSVPVSVSVPISPKAALKNVLRRGAAAAGSASASRSRSRSGDGSEAGTSTGTGTGTDDTPGSAAGTAIAGLATGPGLPHDGFFISFEGGDGSGKSTQLDAVADWLRAKGHEVVTTREPGGTMLGGKLREIVLDARHADAISPRAEALIYAADRADHVARVIRPALERGAIVLTDRYVDSSLAYQGAGRDLPAAEVALLSIWATFGLKPDLTVLMDLDPEAAARRRTGPADRLEAESLDFHARVRARYLELARAEPGRYLVVDASADIAEISERIKGELAGRVPSSAKESEEEGRVREVEAAEAARLESVRLSELSAEERRQAEIEAERAAKARAEVLKREKERREHRERLESDAQRIELDARNRAQEAAARELATHIAAADAASASPTQVAAAAQAAAAVVRAEAVEITRPPASSQWDVPDYMSEPQLDDGAPLSLADELLGGGRSHGGVVER